MLINKVSQYIHQRDLLQRGLSYLVALSGGADSVALMVVLHHLGYAIQAAHCNFHLRGSEADRDEDFCRQLCARLGIKLHVRHFNTKDYADANKVSIEMAARDLRYAFFQELTKSEGLAAVCVAHHKNDSAETLLLNLVRGTGIEGLKGIAPKTDKVVRPLLCVTRKEIEDYLASIKQDYITDSTNLIDDVQRNKIRLRLMPLLQEINLAALENISKAAERVEGSLGILKQAFEEAKRRVATEANGRLTISIQAILSEPSPETILWELIKHKAFTSAQAEQIFRNINTQTGKEWNSPTHSLFINRGNIIIEPATLVSINEILIPQTGRYIIAGGKHIEIKTIETDEQFEPSREPFRIHLDSANIAFPFSLRTVKPGDWFIPFGMSGRKLVSDFLTDRKLSLPDKRRQLVLTDSKGNILWLVGLRTDNRLRISSNTKQALEIAIIDTEN